MAATPESKVKAKVVAILTQYGAYHFYPVASGYGRSGIPDIVACWQGRFFGIECKTRTGRVTDLQIKNLTDIRKKGGVAILIDESGLGVLALSIATWSESGIPAAGQALNWTELDVDWEAHTKPTE